MMITEQLIELQNWYLVSLRKSLDHRNTAGGRDIYRKDALNAFDEYYETYGEVIPLCNTMMT